MDDSTLFIGLGAPPEAKAAVLLNRTNLYESNVIVWSPPSVLRELKAVPPTGAANKASHGQLEHRLHELSAWVEAGHTLIVVGSPYLTYKYILERTSTRSVNLTDTPLFANVGFSAAVGERVEFCGPQSIAGLLKDFAPHLSYTCVLEDGPLTPLFRVVQGSRGKVQVVGAIKPHGNGSVIFVPDYSQAIGPFVDALAAVPAQLGTPKTVLPTWTLRYRTGLERADCNEIDGLQQQASSIQARIRELAGLVERAQEQKNLFAGTGAAFANSVSEALKELGLPVQEGPHPRADLLAFAKGQYLAIEAKGVEGGARESQFRQVERWAAEVHSTLSLSDEEVQADPDLSRYANALKALTSGTLVRDATCKGVLVIGTYRSLPLVDRNEPDFPDAVVRLMSRANVCGMTGVQLFTILQMARGEPTLKKEIVDKILACAGVLEIGRDWRASLKIVP